MCNRYLMGEGRKHDHIYTPDRYTGWFLIIETENLYFARQSARCTGRSTCSVVTADVLVRVQCALCRVKYELPVSVSKNHPVLLISYTLPLLVSDPHALTLLQSQDFRLTRSHKIRSHTLSLAYSLSPSLSLSLFHSHILTLLCFLSLKYSRSLTLTFSFVLTLSTLSLTLTLTLSHLNALTLSRPHIFTFTLGHVHTFKLSHFHTLILLTLSKH